MPHRNRILRLYAQALRLARSWSGPQHEREYIIREATFLFRRNQFIQDPAAIEAKIFEAESRIALANHYKIPYPRPYHFDRSTRTMGFKFVECPYTHTQDEFWKADHTPHYYDPQSYVLGKDRGQHDSFNYD